MLDINRNFFGSMDSMMGMDMDLDTDVVPNEGVSVSEDSPGQPYKVAVVEVFLKRYFLLRQMAA